MPRVIHFEMAAERPEALADFYSGVFGWKFQKWEGPQEYWLITTGESGPGIDGGLMRQGPGGMRTVNTIDVPSIDDFLDRIEEAGGSVIAPKTGVPGVGWMAYCSDPEGTIFGIMQEDSEAE